MFQQIVLRRFSARKSGMLHKNEITSLDENEQIHILRALELTNWRIGGEKGAAKLLGIKRTTVNARMKKLNIQSTMNEKTHP